MGLPTITLLAGSALFAQAPEAERPTFPPALEKFLGLAPGQAGATVDANKRFRDDPLRHERAECLKSRELSEFLKFGSVQFAAKPRCAILITNTD
jgi:hypothetical protein